MKLDLLELNTFRYTTFISFLLFLFSPFNLAMKIFFLALLIYFLVIFSLCVYWAKEWHPDRRFIIGFLVSVFHTFIFLFSGLFSLALSQITLKFSPLLLNYFREILRF
jgi:hypothetical protein